MTIIEQYVKERDEALFTLDEAKIKDFCRGWGQPIPDDPYLFWASIYKCICNIPDAPADVRAKASEWLAANWMDESI